MSASSAAEAREVAALIALLRAGSRRRVVYADVLEATRSPELLLEQEQGLLAPALIASAADEVARWQEQGFRVVSLLDAEYPENLRAVHDRPPLLFLAGRLHARDARAVAVIGSRQASTGGLARARVIAQALVESGHTVVSGLAAGIDTAAHRAALEIGGRTLAVIGTGLGHSYPAVNASLQRTIAREAAVVSQFWPEEGPRPKNFPKRNAVMSGIALATVVVEASAMSGARTQIRAALKHGRPVLLLDALLEQQWARELADRPGIYVIRSAAELLEVLAALSATDRLRL